MSTLSTEVSYRVVKAVLNSQFSKLSDAATGSLSVLSEKMFEKNLIGESVKNDPDFNKILRDFKAGIHLLGTTEELEATLEVFLDVLRDVGGPLETAASRIRSSVETAMNEERAKQAETQTVRNTDHSSQNRQLEEAHMFVASVGGLKDHILDSTDPPLNRTAGESFHLSAGDESYQIMPNDVQEENGTTTTQFTTVSNGNLIADPKNPIVVAENRKKCVNSTLVTDDSDPVNPSLSPVQQGTVPTQVSRLHSSPGHATQLSVRGIYKHHHSCPDCNELSSLRLRFDEDQRAKISELKQKVEVLEAERKNLLLTERQKLDDSWKKLRHDQQLLNDREKQLEEDRRQHRKLHKEEEDYLTIKRKDNRNELDIEKRKLQTEHRERLSNLERIKRQQRKEMELDKAKIIQDMNEGRRVLAESIKQSKADIAKDEQLFLKRQEKLASFEVTLQETESKLKQERLRLFQKEHDLKDLQWKLETREIQLREAERFERQRQLEAHGDIEEKQARLDEISQKLKAKWNDYWTKEKQFFRQEKSFKNKVEVFENQKSRHNQDLFILIVVIAVLWVFTWAGTDCTFEIPFNFLLSLLLSMNVTVACKILVLDMWSKNFNRKLSNPFLIGFKKPNHEDTINLRSFQVLAFVVVNLISMDDVVLVRSACTFFTQMLLYGRNSKQLSCHELLSKNWLYLLRCKFKIQYKHELPPPECHVLINEDIATYMTK